MLKAGDRGTFSLYLSAEIIEETRQKLLTSARLRSRYSITDPAVQRFCDGLRQASRLVAELPPIDPVCRDPDDDHVLAAAVAAGASCIVTGDLDLLDLGEYEGIRILTVRAFLEALDGLS